MTEDRPTFVTLQEEYIRRLRGYEKLGEYLKSRLSARLEEAGTEIHDITVRIKDFESFRDKVEREKWQEPFEDCADICGLRILHYFKSDADKITRTIEEATQVVSKEEIILEAGKERFGVAPQQFVVCAKQGALSASEAQEFNGLKAEIQVISLVMDAWMKIEQHLAYESGEHIQDQFRRQFYQLASLFDQAEDTLEGLKQAKSAYSEQISDEARARGEFNISLPMNLDNLQAFLDHHFPRRKKNLKVVSWLLVNIILQNNITMRQLVEAYNKVKLQLPAIEREMSEILKERYFFKEKEFERTQGIMLMSILSLTNEDYWKMVGSLFDERYWENLLEFFHAWRTKINLQ